MKASLTIAGIEVELSIPESTVETIVARRYAPFLGPVAAPVCSVGIHPGHGLDGAARSPVTVERLGTAFDMIHPGFFGAVDLEGPGSLECAPSPYAIDHALRVVFALVAPRQSALMLEASGVISRGGAHVFAGPQGAGKSTVAALAGHRPLLTDGYVMVRRLVHGSWLAASTPFWGAHEVPGPPRDVRLARLWSIRPSRTVHAVPSDAGASLRSVVENIFLPACDPASRRAALDLASELASAVPSSELGLVPTPDLWCEIEASVA
jgi:hypothetical protein